MAQPLRRLKKINTESDIPETLDQTTHAHAWFAGKRDFRIEMVNKLLDTPVASTNEKLMHVHASFEITFVERDNYIHLKWIGRQTHQSIQEGCNQMLRLLIELGADKIMNDGRYSVGCWTASLPWIVFRLLPQLRRGGMRQAAHIISYDRASKLSADSFRLIADVCHWNIEFFRNVEQAREWLAQGATGER